MIQAVLFDFDGVLTTEKTGSFSTLRSLSHHTGIPLEVLKPAYHRFNPALLRGQMTHQDMWADFCREVGQDIDPEQLDIAFVETPLDCAMLDILEDLHTQCKTGLITNNKVDRIQAIFDHHSLWSHFDAVSVSAAVGSCKDESAIFEDALHQLGLAANECLFIDNTERNLIVPQRMGMATVLFDDDHRDPEGLRRLLYAYE